VTLKNSRINEGAEERDMDTQGNELTLEGLAHSLQTLQRENAENARRINALERENEQMRAENADLRGNVAPLDGAKGTLLNRPQADPGPPTDTVVLADADTVVEADLMRTHKLEATSRVNPIFADSTPAVEALAHGPGPAVRAKNDSRLIDAPGVEGSSQDGPGVYGYSPNHNGVQGQGRLAGVQGSGWFGVKGHSEHQGFSGVKGEGVTGVWGVSSTPHFSGVFGEHIGDSSGYGTVGIGTGGDAGALGRNLDKDGLGVHGETNNTDGLAGVKGEGVTGVWGLSSTTGHAGVYGEHTGARGHGIVGIGKVDAGVLGRNGTGTGVRGEGLYGGFFQGSKAQLMLKPGDSAGEPASGTHAKGEIYMDSAGTLFVCVAKGNPGTWREVTTTEDATTTV
jgi:hypothetical protein